MSPSLVRLALATLLLTIVQGCSRPPVVLPNEATGRIMAAQSGVRTKAFAYDAYLQGGPYWMIKKSGDNVDKVYGRIGGAGFQKYDRIKNSPVYAEGVLMNAWSRE